MIVSTLSQSMNGIGQPLEYKVYDIAAATKG